MVETRPSAAPRHESSILILRRAQNAPVSKDEAPERYDDSACDSASMLWRNMPR